MGKLAKLAASTSRTGECFADRYLLGHKLHHTGMGELYQAKQIDLERRVTVEIISGELVALDYTFSRRFTHEVAACAAVMHPGLAVVHDFGHTDGFEYYISSQHLDGPTLLDELATGKPMSIDRVVRIGLELARALRHAHKAGVVHRSLEPRNVVLTPGDDGDDERVVLARLGIAKLAQTTGVERAGDSELGEEGIDLSAGNAMIGAPEYLAPEQICGDIADERTDIYAFGAVLYHMITGAPPFFGDGTPAILRRHLSAPVPPIRRDGDPCPDELAALVMRSLEKLPRARFDTMEALIAELRPLSGDARVRSASMVQRPTAPPDLELPVFRPLSSIVAAAGIDDLQRDAPRERPSAPPVLAVVPAPAAAPAYATPPPERVVGANDDTPPPVRIQPAAIETPRPPRAPRPPRDVSVIERIVRGKKPAWFAVGGVAAAAIAATLFINQGLGTSEPRDTPIVTETETELAVAAPAPAKPGPEDASRSRPVMEALPAGDEPAAEAEPEEAPAPRASRDAREPAREQRPVRDREVRSRGGRDARQPVQEERREVSRPAPAAVAARPTATEPVREPEPQPEAKVEPKPEPAREAKPEPAREAPVAPSLPELEEEAPAAQPPKSKNVAPAVLEQALLERVDPRLPASVRAALAGKKVEIVVLVCTKMNGEVDMSRTRMIRSVAGTDDAVLSALRQWRYRPQPVPLCAPVRFQINVVD